MITQDREYRHFQFERAEGDEHTVNGMPIVFNRETVLYEIDGKEYREKIDPSALDNAIIDDVVLNIDHKGKPAAKTKNGTLKLEVREDGVYMSADLGKNATGRELHEDIANGFYDKMSFAFSIDKSGDTYDRDTRTRTVTKIKRLYDVSAVTQPAYQETMISARSFFELESEKEKMSEDINKRNVYEKKKLKLKLILEESE